MPVNALFSSALLVAVVLLGGCAAPVPPKPPIDTTPKARQPLPQTRASFDCNGALPAVHRQICADETLARLDKELIAQQHRLQQEVDPVGRLLLAANHRQWLLSRGELCRVPDGPDAQAQACLMALYRQRSRELNEWKIPPMTGSGPHALASYAEYRLADNRAPGLCEPLGQELNRDLRSNGLPSPARLSGVSMLAGSHAPTAQARVNGRQVMVELYNPGLYAGYQIRARGLSIEGQPLLDDATLPYWIAEQPNYGGRAHAASSQTGDYGSIDVFQRAGRHLVLVNETWGFHSPAARGESAYAGLYELTDTTLQPRCLYQTYLTPPRTNTLAGLAIYAQLQAELDDIVGGPLPGMAQHERRDSFQEWKEQQWTLLNLPLLGVDALARHAHENTLRQRHDRALEGLFDWSERNLNNKQAYRRVLPMLQPARQELHQLFIGQGLEQEEADTAADLLLHATLARAVESLAAPTQPVPLPTPPPTSWQPRYAIAPAPGDIERGRQFSTLHSVLLNNAPAHVVADFIAYETETRGGQWGRGPDDNPAAAAAVMLPANLRLLLEAGIDPEQGNRWDKTALMSAAEHNQAQSVGLLLQHGANVHRRTRQLMNTGIGGPERREAEQGRQTALLLAAGHAGAEVLQLLIDAGAARQAWEGYDRQVCQALQDNIQLADTERERLQGPLCGSYAALPVAERVQLDVRRGDVLPYRLDGVEYRISLLQRPATLLFGRSLDSTPEKLEREVHALAVKVGTAAVRRGHLQLTGPLTLYAADLTANSTTTLQLHVGYPVSSGAGHVAGYTVLNQPSAQVLSVRFDRERNDSTGTWRALLAAAREQGLAPTNQGFIVLHTRDGQTTEYQLVVTDRPQEKEPG